jgi:methylaspartate ammonia-lyase
VITPGLSVTVDGTNTIQAIADRDGFLIVGDAVTVAQYPVLTRTDSGSCPSWNLTTQLFVVAGGANDSQSYS